MRRFELDWIRVFVFALLIFYHIGMFFVDSWNWHIKNNTTYEWLKYPMQFINQWRLPILFLVSGMGTRYALSSRNAKEFLSERFKRLFIPLIFGMLIIVAPQVYVERIVEGQFVGNFIKFYPHYFDGVYPEGNFSWHHLWFLPYLFVYSLLFTPIFIYLRNHPSLKIISFSKKLVESKFGLLIFLIPLVLIVMYLRPHFKVTHNLYNDWYNFIYSMTYFFYGYLFILLGESFWKSISSIKYIILFIAILAFCSIMWIINLTERFPYISEVYSILKAINTFSWILVVLAFCNQHWNSDGKYRNYLNQAVYPFYILHQTITVCLAFYLYDSDMNDGFKFIILTVGTFAGCWIIFELIRRNKVTRLLFGIKEIKNEIEK